MRRRYRQTFKPRSIRKSESRAKKRLIFNLVLIVLLIYVFFTWGLPFIVGSLSFLNKYKTDKPQDVVRIDDAITPPILSIPFESTNSAQLKISGYSMSLSKVEIYIDDELKNQTSTDSNGKFESDPISLNLGTNNIYAVTINDADKKSLPSKTIKVYYSDEKPSLDISEPSDNAEIKGGDKKIKVVGKTDKDNNVTINGSTIIVNSEGAFQAEIPLNEGDNVITIAASNNFGNSNSLEKRVKYTP